MSVEINGGSQIMAPRDSQTQSLEPGNALPFGKRDLAEVTKDLVFEIGRLSWIIKVGPSAPRSLKREMW